jgi:hypothetical protein
MIRLLVTTAAAAAVSGSLFAQSEFTSKSPEEQLRGQIAELQAETGLARPASLIAPLRALAVLYQETDDHALASAALEEARYVTRVHQGLASADEALLLRQQIRSEKALGNDERVWGLEQDMVTIARQHHDDIRMVPIFRELAEDRRDVIEKVRAGELPPMIFLGCYDTWGLRRYDDTRGKHQPPPGGSCEAQAGTPGVIRNLRAEVLIYYADAIETVLKNGDYASQELRDLEKQAVRMFPGLFDPTTWLTGNQRTLHEPRHTPLSLCNGIWPGSVNPGVGHWANSHAAKRGSSETLDELLASEILGTCLEPVVSTNEFVTANVGGWVSLVRLIAYEIRSGAPAAARAKAFTDLADWCLLLTPVERRHFSESSEHAIELYQRAYRELQQDDAARAAMFSPQAPVTFGPNLFTSIATQSSRYIDVSFEITKYGRGERIKVLDTSKGATRAEERELSRLIESTTFRPRFVDGKLADSAPVIARYDLDARL